MPIQNLGMMFRAFGWNPFEYELENYAELIDP